MLRIYSSMRLLLPILIAALVGCQTVKAPPAPQAKAVAPLATHSFTFDPERDSVVGELQMTQVRNEDTLSDIARRFNIGYEEIVRANPTVDPWLPRVGSNVILPTQFVLPDAPRSGIVINLAALRLYYFPPRKKNELQTVITHPIGIGMVGWTTPLGTTKVTGKRENPWWYPPSSVRKEHAEDGDPLPQKVAPGPDNPLGKYALMLDWPSYLIHGTNQPYGVGIRASHGCIRMYPEDIALLYDDIPVGTSVTVVNQPIVYGKRGEQVYVQTFPVLDDYTSKNRTSTKNKAKVKNSIAKNNAIETQTIAQTDKKSTGPAVTMSTNSTLVTELSKNPRGITVPVSAQSMSIESYLSTVRLVENRLPAQATWNGVE